MIQSRDDEHRALNKAYGYVEKDGTTPIGCKSHVDLDYKRKYDEIEARFREPYDRGLPDLYDWCKRECMSIFECLWIDNIYTDHLEIVAAESAQKPDWQMNYIARKAGLFVEKLKAAHSVGEIKRLIEMEVQHHGYAVTRCRMMLDIKPWEIGKQKALLDYRRDWKTLWTTPSVLWWPARSSSATTRLGLSDDARLQIADCRPGDWEPPSAQ